MVGPGIKRARSTDKRSEEHMTSIVHPEKPSVGSNSAHAGPSCTLAGLEQAYEAWLRNYMNQPGRTWGVYRPAENEFVIRAFSAPADKGSIFGYVRDLMAHYAFFPRTPVLSHPRFLSDEDAVLNDWAIVGTDLYGAIRQYRMNSPLVRAVTETDEYATATR